MHTRVLAFVLVIALLTLPLSVAAQDDPRAFPKAFAAQLQKALDKAVSPEIVPGAVLLIDAPKARFFSAAGYADVEGQVLMTPERAFRIGSLTKMFTAVVLLQLQEEGFLSLDDRMIDWLPEEMPKLPYDDRITVRQLLNHTAGVYNYTDDQMLIELYGADPLTAPSLDVIFERLSALATPAFAPGESWAYSNTNYLLAGKVIEQVTSQPVAEVFRARIFAPLGLSHTYLAGAEPDSPALVHGYTTDADSGEQVDTLLWDVSWAWTAGALVSTAEDLLIFVRALFAGALFQDPSSLEQMLTVVDVGGGVGYGLGIGTSSGGDWGHSGGIPGYVSTLTYIPSEDLVLVVLLNGDSPRFNPSLLNLAIRQALRVATAP